MSNRLQIENKVDDLIAKVSSIEILVRNEDIFFEIESDSDAVNKIKNPARLQKIIQDGYGNELFNSGSRIHTVWTDRATNTTYIVPLIVMDIGEYETDLGSTIPGVKVIWEKTSPFGVQFDGNEAFYSVPSGGLSAGTYSFTIGTTWGSKDVIKDKVFNFTLMSDVAEGGQLLLGLANSTTSGLPDNVATAWRVYSYATPTTYSPTEVVTVSEGEAGTNLGTLSTSTMFGDAGLNNLHRSAYGYNRWSMAGIRQFLNGFETPSNWYTPMHDFDRPPTELTTKYGFLSGYNEDFLNIIRKVEVKTALNTISDSDIVTSSNDHIETTYDKTFLPCLEEINIQPQLAGEGVPSDYWKNRSGSSSLLSRGVVRKEYRIPQVGTTTSFQYSRLRSAYRGNACSAWNVNTAGNVYSSDATSSFRFSPEHVLG